MIARDSWSFGCTRRPAPRSPPSSSDARLASTSFMFICVWVPEPVCHTGSGKCASCWPAITSSAADTIAAASDTSSRPSSALAPAAAALTCANAVNQGQGHALMADLKMSACPLGLGAPQGGVSDLNRAEAVVFCACRSCPPCLLKLGGPKPDFVRPDTNAKRA